MNEAKMLKILAETARAVKELEKLRQDGGAYAVTLYNNKCAQVDADFWKESYKAGYLENVEFSKSFPLAKGKAFGIGWYVVCEDEEELAQLKEEIEEEKENEK